MALTRAIRKERPDILIAVDHEGGRVQRFRFDGSTRLPPMRALGKLWENEPKSRLPGPPRQRGMSWHPS